MTNKKASKILGVMDFDLVSLHGPIEKVTEYCEACCMGADALMNADKYKWHDLRKNPKDLPHEDGTYRCVFKDDINNYFDCYYMKGIGFGENVFDAHNEFTGSPIEYYFESFDEDDEVIGWQEREPFEVE